MLKYNTCAHARPGLRPFVPLDCKDHDPVFPVSPCCTRSVQYKVAEPRSYISALPDRDRCESCPLFTDPDTLVHIQADTFRADIYLDRLCDLTITNTRKLFKLMHRWDFDNRQAIDRLTAHLEQAIQESEDAWKLASREFTDGWRKVSNPKSRHPAVVETLKNNNRLTRKVKAAKARHERWVKIKALGWFAFALQTAFGNTGGWRAHKNDALRRAVSLDAPPSEDGGEDDRALAELVEDPSAAQGLQGVEDSIFLDQLHAALERALQRLPEAEGDAIRGKYFEGRELSRDEKNAEHRGMSKLINPALHAELLQYIEDRTPYYLRVGIQTQRNTGESAVEKIVFKREALRRKVWLE